jgi:hypothetical protein
MNESSQDVEPSSPEVKESSHRLKESSHDVKESSHDVKESSHDVKESSHDVKESSQRRFPLQSARSGPEDAVEGLLRRRQGRVAHVSEKLASSSRLKSVGFGPKDDVE